MDVQEWFRDQINQTEKLKKISAEITADYARKILELKAAMEQIGEKA